MEIIALFLPNAHYGITNTTETEDVLKTPQESHVGYAVDVNLKYHDKFKSKTKYFPFCPDFKKVGDKTFIDFINSFKPKHSKSKKKLICDWSDKSKHFTHYVCLGY